MYCEMVVLANLDVQGPPGPALLQEGANPSKRWIRRGQQRNAQTMLERLAISRVLHVDDFLQ
jgi:hypothetical protein